MTLQFKKIENKDIFTRDFSPLVTVFEIHIAVFVRQQVIGNNTDLATVGYRNNDFTLFRVDRYDVEGYKRFAVVQFELRKIILYIPKSPCRFWLNLCVTASSHSVQW